MDLTDPIRDQNLNIYSGKLNKIISDSHVPVQYSQEYLYNFKEICLSLRPFPQSLQSSTLQNPITALRIPVLGTYEGPGRGKYLGELQPISKSTRIHSSTCTTLLMISPLQHLRVLPKALSVLSRPSEIPSMTLTSGPQSCLTKGPLQDNYYPQTSTTTDFYSVLKKPTRSLRTSQNFSSSSVCRISR